MEQERLNMSAIDYSHLTTDQRIDLIEELCASLKHDAARLTEAQAAELDRRLAMLPDLRARYGS
jgi:putative addiction module component (TIGR02574 family)